MAKLAWRVVFESANNPDEVLRWALASQHSTQELAERAASALAGRLGDSGRVRVEPIPPEEQTVTAPQRGKAKAANYTVTVRLRAALEKRLGPQLGAFLRAQGEGAAKAYGVGGMPEVGVRLALDAPKLGALLRANYTTGTVLQAGARFDRLGVPAPAYLNARAVFFAETQSARRVVDIDSATRDRIQRVVVDSFSNKLTTSETADAVGEALVGSSRARSFAIARTEVGTATAYGDHLAAQESGLDLVKVWTTAGSGLRHPSYPGLDGQEREMNEPFEVGDALLQFPLDPAGPPEEVVNCRCALDYRQRRR